MESRANYIIVGAFILLLGFGAIGFALWMGNYSNHKEYAYYYTYMHESVAGLPPDGSVKYMGVDIGKVKEIHIDPDDPTRIRIKLQLPKDFPVRKGMYATLKFTGITGIAYIEIVGGKRNAPLIKAEKDKIPVIPSKPSILARLGTSVSDVVAKITTSLDKISSFLNTSNMDRLENTLKNIEASSKSLEKIMSEKNAKNIDTLLANLADASKRSDEIFKAVKAIQATTEDIGREGNKTLLSVQESAISFKHLSETLTEKLEKGDLNIRQLLQRTLAQSNQLMRASQTLIYQLQEDAELIKNSPRDLFFKEAEPTLGPGEREK